MRSSIRLCGISAAALWLAMPTTAQDVPLLDLTQPVAEGTSTARRHRTLSYKISNTPKDGDWPVDVRLLSFDRAQYREGDPFIAEIELHARDSVVVPWSADATAVDPQRDYQAPGFRGMILYLADGNGMGVESSGRVVGSRLAPESLKALKPGDRVRIRLSGFWSFLPGGPAHVGPGMIAWQAVLTTVDEGGLARSAIRSQNAVRVQIAP